MSALHCNNTTKTNPLTCSRSNCANVVVAMTLLESLINDEATTAVIAPYADQRVLYVRALLEMANQNLPKNIGIKTIDNKIQKPVEKEAEILAHCKQFGGDAIKCSWSHCPR
jgi:hypothetical protein